MRDRETIDSELRRLAAERRLLGEHGGQLTSRELDRLLDERLGHHPEPDEPDAIAAVPYTRSPRSKSDDVTRNRRMRVRRFGLPMALPLSLVATVAAAVTMFAIHRAHPAADPAVDPPSDARPSPAAQQPPPIPPLSQAPQLGIVDKALIAALQHEGVPVPSNDYVTTQGHAVCDFLAQQPDYAEAVRFVQRSSIWDADQSANVTAGAVISYCPKYEPAQSDKTQQVLQDSQSALQAIQGDLQGINDDVKGIRDGLHPGSP